MEDARDIITADGWTKFRGRAQRIFSTFPLITLHSDPGASVREWQWQFAQLLDWADSVGYDDKAQRSGVSLKDMLDENNLIDQNVIHQLARINALSVDLEITLRGPVEHKPDEKRKDEQNEGDEGDEIKEEREQKSESHSQLIAHVQHLYMTFQNAITHLFESTDELMQRATANKKSSDPSYGSSTDLKPDSESLDEFASGKSDAMGPDTGEPQLGGSMDHEASDEQEPDPE